MAETGDEFDTEAVEAAAFVAGFVLRAYVEAGEAVR